MLVAIALMGLVSSSSGVERQQTIKSPANGTADRIALLVANANYPDAEAPLPYIRADESALADALRQKGYDVEFVADATREQLLQAVNTAEAKMRPGSTVVLSFAGYAVQSQEQNYLLPVDAKIWTERDVRVQGFSVDELLSELEHTGARERIALLDASYRNPFERRFRSYSHGLAPMLNGQNQVMESSVPPDEVVDAAYNSRGSLAKPLVAELQVPQARSDATQVSPSAAARAIFARPVTSLAPTGRGGQNKLRTDASS
jgi:hypothetical protein